MIFEITKKAFQSDMENVIFMWCTLIDVQLVGKKDLLGFDIFEFLEYSMETD